MKVGERNGLHDSERDEWGKLEGKGVRAIPNMSTDWEKNSLRAALLRRTWELWWTKSLT